MCSGEYVNIIPDETTIPSVKIINIEFIDKIRSALQQFEVYIKQEFG
jgi:hypothetical protein